MISPCDPAILSNNPQFKALHQQLTTAILNPDGSTRANATDPSRRAVQALRNLVSVIVLYLQHSPNNNNKENGNKQISPDETSELLSLLSPDLKKFHSAIPSLIPSITAILAADLTHLKTLANASPPVNNSSNNDRHNYQTATNTTSFSSSARIATNKSKNTQPRPSNRLRPLSLKPSPTDISLPSQLSSRLRTLRTIQSHDLPTARNKMTVTAAAVLAAHAEVMERVIHILERAKHGVLARGVKARADHVAVVLEGVEGKVCIMRHEMLSAIYTPETTAALTRYRDHLGDTRLRLEERRKQALLELEAYERADMGEMGKREAAGVVEGKGDEGGGGDGSGKPGAMVEIARSLRTQGKRPQIQVTPYPAPLTRTNSTDKQHSHSPKTMTDADSLSIYDEIEIEDMTYDATLQIYHYPCPCGDRFEIGVADLRDGEEIAVCPSCSLMVRVIYDLDDLPKESDASAGAIAITA
ncbi:diphthamide biosynthesis protein [Histoplasma capsulatum G186AR]|uniref:Diphthamide biosynthesis protein 3 n=2 Tax=Histoplasma TaxID=5036 RepID=C0NMW0_AJECG|nr:diphthamide biosynthesis protein [Histoplasma capsulatum G186AR]EEH07208.1 diphthamide biosynthesis protein [Histoplasma capsulatum G186AR]